MRRHVTERKRFLLRLDPALYDVLERWAGDELRILKLGWRDLELIVTVQPGDEPGFHRAVAERIARRALFRLAEEPIPEELRIAPLEVQLDAAEAETSQP